MCVVRVCAYVCVCVWGGGGGGGGGGAKENPALASEVITNLLTSSTRTGIYTLTQSSERHAHTCFGDPK